MTEKDRSKKLREDLIAQDAHISESQLEEFRMNLGQSLETIEKRAESSRRATIRSVVAVIVCYVGLYLSFMARGLGTYTENAIAVLSICTWVALISAAVFVTRYWGWHRPALERGRLDLQIAMFAELQRQMNQIVQRLDGQAKT
jgi:hypothetical protein